MTSGYETLSQLTPESYDYFNELGDLLEKGLKEVFAKHQVPITVNRAGSMIGYFLVFHNHLSLLMDYLIKYLLDKYFLLVRCDP
jgi:glutamate-1-semialdehyde aminotransferase